MRFRSYRPSFEALEKRDLPSIFNIQVDPDLVSVTQDGNTTTYTRSGPISISGTPDNDAVAVHLTPGNAVQFTILGQGGADSLTVDGTDGNDVAVATQYKTSFKFGNSIAYFVGFESQQLNAGAGYDTIWFYGSTRADKFIHTRSYDWLLNSAAAQKATGFERVEARLQRTDRASLYDGAGTDIFVESGNYARLMDLYDTYCVGV